VNNENKIFTKRHSYSWVMVQSDCSATCGGGEAFDSQSCVFTGSSNPCKFFLLWPKDKTFNRNNDVQCKSLPSLAFHKEEVVAHALCPVTTPAQIQACNNQDCPPEWNPGPWSQCSKTCGRGIMKRDVSCKSVGTSILKIMPESLCNSGTKPEVQQTCVLGRCPKNERLQWVISAWSECSSTCGLGIRRREMQCIEKSIGGKLITFPLRRCRNLKKPSIDLEEVCHQGPCPMHPLYNRISGWYSSPWQQASQQLGVCFIRNLQCHEPAILISALLLRRKMILLVWTSLLGATWFLNTAFAIINFMANSAANHARGRTDLNILSFPESNVTQIIKEKGNFLTWSSNRSGKPYEESSRLDFENRME
ncbi:hypothetical protein E2320_001114, partial [Naja naja]